MDQSFTFPSNRQDMTTKVGFAFNQMFLNHPPHHSLASFALVFNSIKHPDNITNETRIHGVKKGEGKI